MEASLKCTHMCANFGLNAHTLVEKVDAEGRLCDLIFPRKLLVDSEIESRHGRVIMSKENRKPPSGVGEGETIENLRVFLIC